MNQPSSRNAVYLGIGAILVGLVANKWILQMLFSTDGHIGSRRILLLIGLVQITLLGLGIFLIVARPRTTLPSKKDIPLVVVSSVVAIILLEIVLRLWLSHFSTRTQYRQYSLYTDIPAEQFQWSPHHYLNYYPTPNYRRRLLYHNSLGYRSPEIGPTQPHVYRIVLLGGSTTYTIRVEDNERTFPYQLERLLRDDHGYDNVEVINAGVGGYNSWESLINLEFRVLDLDPDLVIVYHGTNDVHTRIVVPHSYIGDNSGRRQQWHPPHIPRFEHSALLRIISRRMGFTNQVGLGTFINAPTFLGPGGEAWSHSKEEAPELLRANPPRYFERNLLNMISIARGHDVSIALATWAHSPDFNDYASTKAYTQGFSESNDVVKDVAERTGAYLYDFASEMSEEKTYWADGRHVNEAGALLKAQLFAEFIDRSSALSTAIRDKAKN